LNLDGTETFDVTGLTASLKPQQDLTLAPSRAKDGATQEIAVTCRIDTPIRSGILTSTGVSCHTS